MRHHPNAIFALALVLLAGAALVAGCGSKDEQEAPATEITVGSKMGNMAPEFTLERVSGGELTLSSLRGKAVIVDFWDTWCPPCKKSLPDLQEISETYADDLVVVGVAMALKGEEDVRRFLAERDFTFEMVFMQQDAELVRAYGGLGSIPTTFLIDQDGVIRQKWVGPAPKAVYEAAVRNVIGSGT